MLLIFPIMTLFRAAYYFPHFMCSVCQSMYTSQVPAKFMEWCVYQVIAEAILWFASAELFMFLIIKVLFMGMIQPVMPIFWWLCLCYEAYISSSSISSPFEPKSIPKGFSFCRTRCIYSEFQLVGSFKYLDSLCQHYFHKQLLSKTASLFIYLCPDVNKSFLLLMRYVP